VEGFASVREATVGQIAIFSLPVRRTAAIGDTAGTQVSVLAIPVIRDIPVRLRCNVPGTVPTPGYAKTQAAAGVTKVTPVKIVLSIRP
jgi:hypothetical protein